MPDYIVNFTNPTGFSRRVTADTPEDAETAAAEHLPGSLCHQCARERDDGDWDLNSVEDADGNVVMTIPLYAHVWAVSYAGHGDEMPVERVFPDPASAKRWIQHQGVEVTFSPPDARGHFGALGASDQFLLYCVEKVPFGEGAVS